MEVDNGEADHLDARLVRRLVRLELADIVIPAPHDAPDMTPPPLYVRIVPQESFLSVELWDHGLLRGERRVSVRQGTSLTARSIALVAAELAKSLAERRRREARAHQLREGRERRRSLAQRGYPIFARVAMDVELEAATIGSDAWAAGPGLRGELRLDRHLRLGIYGRGLQGQQGDVELQWLETGWAPAFSIPVSRRTAATLAADVGVASASFADVRLVDGSTSSTTWNARATVSVSYELRFAEHYSATVGAVAGSTLRTLNLETTSGAAERFGGLWLGMRLGLAFDPG